MTSTFRDLSIRNKLMRISMLVSASVLLLSSLGFIVYELVTFRDTMVRSLSTQAEIIGINTVSALLFNDPPSATETLTALRVKPNILSAAIYADDGRLFARYVRSDGVTIFQMPEQTTEEMVGHRFQGSYLFVSQPIVSGGKRIGLVTIQSDLKEMEDRLKRYAGIVVGVLVISLLAAYGVSSRLQGRISEPILHLAQTARMVSQEKNYSIRAVVESRDEVGQLVETFNEMLAQIQVREEALQKAHDQLEQKVDERTRELHQEIAERKQAEEKFRAVAENANDAIVTADRYRKIIYFNKGAERTFGYSAGEAVGRPLTLLMPERFHAAHHQGFNRFLSTGEARVVGKTVELVGKGKNGREFPVELSLACWKAGGETFFTGILRDITERKRAEEALRASEARYHTLFDSIDEGYCVIEVIFDEQEKPVDYRFLEINSAFEKQTGLIGAQGKRMRELAPGHEEHWFEIYGRIALSGEPARFQNRAEQLRRWYDVYAFRYGEPKNRHVAILFNDITERKRAEEEKGKLTAQLQEANKELEAFSYSVSHDLRAPLRHIDGFSQILLEDYAGKLNEEGRNHLQRVREASQQMAQLIDDLLNLSRVTRAEMRRETVDLSRLAEAIAEALRKTGPERAAEFVIEKGLTAEADERLLRVALDNLLGNAWKYAGKRPRARIEFGRMNHDRRSAFFVRDNGAGFDMAYAHKLFGAFQRLHSVSEFPGTGIGLATVQRIIHRHGGQVWAEGAVDQGATFYFTL